MSKTCVNQHPVGHFLFICFSHHDCSFPRRAVKGHCMVVPPKCIQYHRNEKAQQVDTCCFASAKENPPAKALAIMIVVFKTCCEGTLVIDQKGKNRWILLVCFASWKEILGLGITYVMKDLTVRLSRLKPLLLAPLKPPDVIRDC